MEVRHRQVLIALPFGAAAAAVAIVFPLQAGVLLGAMLVGAAFFVLADFHLLPAVSLAGATGVLVSGLLYKFGLSIASSVALASLLGAGICLTVRYASRTWLAAILCAAWLFVAVVTLLIAERNAVTAITTLPLVGTVAGLGLEASRRSLSQAKLLVFGGVVVAVLCFAGIAQAIGLTTLFDPIQGQAAITEYDGAARVNGPLRSTADYSFVLSFAVAILLAGRFGSGLLRYALLAVAMLAVLLTLTRAAIVAIVVTFAVCALLKVGVFAQRRAVSVIAGCVLAIGAYLGASLIYDDVDSRILGTAGSGDVSYVAKTEVQWPHALKEIFYSPLMPTQGADTLSTVDNTLLTAAVRVGLPCVAVFIGLVVVLVIRGSTLAGSRAHAIALLSATVFCLFVDAQNFSLILNLYGILIGATWMSISSDLGSRSFLPSGPLVVEPARAP